MNIENYKTLYEKTQKELKPAEIDYLQKILAKNRGNFLTKFAFFVTPTIFIIGSLSFTALGFPLNLATFSLMASAGLIIGGALSLLFASINTTLKSLGLTRKDWKTLKKSGRIKELSVILQNIETLKLTNLTDNIVENNKLHETDIILEIPDKEYVKLTNKSSILEGENTTNYEELYIQERVEQLKQEEGYLVKRLAQIKQEKSNLLKAKQELSQMSSDVTKTDEFLV